MKLTARFSAYQEGTCYYVTVVKNGVGRPNPNYTLSSRDETRFFPTQGEFINHLQFMGLIIPLKAKFYAR